MPTGFNIITDRDFVKDLASSYEAEVNSKSAQSFALNEDSYIEITAGSGLLILDSKTKKMLAVSSSDNSTTLDLPKGTIFTKNKEGIIIAVTIPENSDYPVLQNENNFDPTTPTLEDYFNNRVSKQKEDETDFSKGLETAGVISLGLISIPVFSVLEVGQHALVEAPLKQFENLNPFDSKGILYESKVTQPLNTLTTKLFSGTAIGIGKIANNVSERFLSKSIADKFIDNASKFAGRNSFGFSKHIDYISLMSQDLQKRDFVSFAKHTTDEAYETAAQNYILKPLWEKAGGQKLENGAVELAKKGSRKIFGRWSPKVSDFLEDALEVRDPSQVQQYIQDDLKKAEEALEKAKKAHAENPTTKTEKAFNKANSKFEKAAEKAAKFNNQAANSADDAARAATSSADDVANAAAKTSQTTSNASKAASTTSTVANNADDVATAAAKTTQAVSTTSQTANTTAAAANTSQAASGTSAAANTTQAASTTAATTQTASATTAETQAALKSTTFLTKCGTAVSKVSAVLNNPIVSKSFGVLGAASGGFQIYSGISDLTKDTTGMSAEQVEELHSNGRETIVKGAVGVAAGVLMFTPVGWVAGAGAAIYMGADYLSEKMFGKSISSAIGDGVNSAYNAVKEDPSKLLYLTPVAPFKAIYDAYNYFFGDDKESANKATASETAAIKAKPTPQKDLLKSMNLNPEKDKNKYSYEINNDVLKIQLEVNKKIKEANRDLPKEHDLKTLSCDGKLGKQTLLKMHELGLDDEALKLTGLRKQAYNELIDLAKKSQYSNDPKEKEEASKLADIHMKRINSKENYGKVYSANDLDLALNSIKDKKVNPQNIKARMEKSKTEINSNKFKGNFDVSDLIPESMRNIPAESTAVNIPLSYVEREAGSLANRNPANFTRNS